MKRIALSLLILATQTQLGLSALGQEAPLDDASALRAVVGDDTFNIIVVGVAVLLIAGMFFAAVYPQLRGQRESPPMQTKVPESGSVGALERQTMAPTDARRDGKYVFISYRRGDSADITGRIYDRLVQHFGKDFIFKDVDSIPLGIDFRQRLESAVGQCSVLLAIIGRGWLEAKMKSGKRRLDDSRDHLRIEIEAALKREVPVIPVLVQGASIPSEDDLAPSLQSLAYRNSVYVRADPDFHGDMDRLIRGIQAHLR